MRSLGLKSQRNWRDYCRSGKKPDDLPAAPHQTYKDDGWAGMGDWLGTGIVANRLRRYRPFEKARSFARDLGLKSQSDWFAYCKSGKKPHDIPTAASVVYSEGGWVSWGDWLGTGVVAPRYADWLGTGTPPLTRVPVLGKTEAVHAVFVQFGNALARRNRGSQCRLASVRAVFGDEDGPRRAIRPYCGRCFQQGRLRAAGPKWGLEPCLLV